MADNKRSRRGYGEGSIYQRPDGRWSAVLSAGYDGKGKRIRRTIYGWTKKEVQDELAKLQNKKAHGTLTAPTRTTLAQFLNQWAEDVARVTVRATTLASYKGIIANHISPRLGGVGLQKLTPAHVEGMYAAMEKDGASPRLRQLTHAVLRRALKKALKWGLIVRNVCDAVEPPRIEKKDIVPLTPEQVGKLLAAAQGDRLEALYVVAIGSGLRLGELFGLQWVDVNLKSATISVRHTLTEVNGKLTLSEPKTAKSRRLVTLPRPAVDALLEHRKRMIATGRAGVEWVFYNSTGGPLRRSHFHRSDFKPLLKLAKLPSIRFHDLRHTSATLLLQQGVHPKIVQERLGHSQISITLDTYSHVLPAMEKEAAGLLDSLLVPTASAKNGSKMAVNAG